MLQNIRIGSISAKTWNILDRYYAEFFTRSSIQNQLNTTHIVGFREMAQQINMMICNTLPISDGRFIMSKAINVIDSIRWESTFSDHIFKSKTNLPSCIRLQPEAYKLQMDLDLLVKEGSKEMKEVARQMKNILKRDPLIATMTMECCLLYGWNVRYGKMGTLYNYGEKMECCKPYGWNNHRKTLHDVNAFWKKIELNNQLQNIEVEGTNSLISTSAETLRTTIGNINYTIGNINNTLKLPGNQIDDSTLGCKRACENDKESPPTPPNKVRILKTGYNNDSEFYNGESSSSDSEIIQKSLTNVFLEAKNCGDDNDNDDNDDDDNVNNGNLEVYQRPISESVDDSNNILESVSREVQQMPVPESMGNNKQNDNVPKHKVTRNKPKYIEHNLAQELLTNLHLCPLKGHKWLWEGIDISNIFKDNKNAKTPLNIGVVNFHNNSCIQPLPSSMITYIQKQMENDNEDIIFFDNDKKIGINKFAIDIDEEVKKFLNEFQDCVSLDVLRQTLHKNSVHNHPNLNFNICYVYQFFNHMYNLYSNDMLSQSLTESMNVWTDNSWQSK
ncbi:14879_t:CDS:10, partial [Funneliformis geosporum]